MVGLSIILESQKGPQVINKTTMSSVLNNIKPSSSSSSSSFSSSSSSSHHSCFQIPTFLDQCFLCRKRLSPGEDIYMYKGDKAFCSVECRCKQIFMDEEESIQKENCSLAAMRPTSSASSSSSPTPSHHRKGARNRARGGFAY